MSKLKIVLAIFVAVVAAFFIYDDWQKYNDKNFQVIFLNIGQGDSALIKFRNGEKMLVDCGPDKTVLARLGEHLSFFDKTIDYLVVTHPDLDHYGGCVDVVRRYHVKNIIENGDTKNDFYFSEWSRTAAGSGAGRQIVKDFAPWTIASTTINWLYPNSAVKVEKPDSNNLSIVFKMSDISGRSFLFTGDAEWPLENALLKNYCVDSTRPLPTLSLKGEGVSVVPPSFQGGGEGEVVSPCLILQSDYLKIGHHGSDSSSGADWLAAVAPKTAIISVGKNKFGHPSLRVLRHLQRQDAEILRTDQIGDIIVTQNDI